LRDLSGEAQSVSFVIDHVRGEGRKARPESINQICEETRSIVLVKILLTSRAYIPRASDCPGGVCGGRDGPPAMQLLSYRTPTLDDVILLSRQRRSSQRDMWPRKHKRNQQPSLGRSAQKEKRNPAPGALCARDVENSPSYLRTFRRQPLFPTQVDLGSLHVSPGRSCIAVLGWNAV